MLRATASATLAALLCTASLATAQQDPPAVRAATAERREALKQMIAAAVKEGELSYWDIVIQAGTNTALVNAFRQHYGLPAAFKVNYSLGFSGNVVSRVDQETAAGRVTMDVVAIASVPWVLEKVKAGHVMAYASPEYVHYKGAFEKGLGKDGYFAFNGAYLFVPMWDASKVKFAGTSWKDVFNAVPTGQLSVGDASKSVTYLATHLGLRQVLGVDYFKQLATMKPVFLMRSEQIANQLVTGQNGMAFSGMPTRAFQFNKKGADLKFMLPKEGVVLLPQAQFILAKAPHPNAARLWVDFILSEPGQKLLVEHEALISGRAAFKSPIPDYAPAIDTLNVIKVDWEKYGTPDLEKARAEWSSVFNP